MKSLLPMLLLALCAGAGAAAAADPEPYPEARSGSIPLNFSVGVSGTITSLGGYGEVIVDRVWALQIQYFDYHEFVGVFNLHAPNPVNEFTALAIHAGVYAKTTHLKAGIFSGAGMVDGVVRGRRHPGQESGCSEGCTYQTLEGKRFVVPLKFVLGVNAANVGISLTPQIYFHDGPVFGTTLLNLEIGVL